MSADPKVIDLGSSCCAGIRNGSMSRNKYSRSSGIVCISILKANPASSADYCTHTALGFQEPPRVIVALAKHRNDVRLKAVFARLREWSDRLFSLPIWQPDHWSAHRYPSLRAIKRMICLADIWLATPADSIFPLGALLPCHSHTKKNL